MVLRLQKWLARFSKQPVSRNNLREVLFRSPEEVAVTETENDKTLVLELHVAQADMGKVIGKQGRIAKAIRAVVKAAAAKSDKKVIVDIVQ